MLRLPAADPCSTHVRMWKLWIRLTPSVARLPARTPIELPQHRTLLLIFVFN